MCGLLGFTGRASARRILGEGLKRLEYRGYDACGYVVRYRGRWKVRKEIGPGGIERLSASLPAGEGGCVSALGHTRWATHGKNTPENTHPHLDCRREIAVVHNGIIDNYQDLKSVLRSQGHQFAGETDSEVIPHLIEEYAKRYQVEKAIRLALQELKGSFAVGIILRSSHRIYVAVNGLPLVLGRNKRASFFSSDPFAISPFADRMFFLQYGEVAALDPGGVEVRALATGCRLTARFDRFILDLKQADKGVFSHFMLKEIFDQPEVLERTIRKLLGHEVIGQLSREFAERNRRLIIIGCGTSWHAGLVGKYLVENLAGISVEVDYASEFRYRKPVFSEDDVVLAVSQSGETADTLFALREARRRGCRIATICNVSASSIARESDYVLCTEAGPEMGVASTKAFTAQLATLYLMSVRLAESRSRITGAGARKRIKAIQEVPALMEKVLARTRGVEDLASLYRGKISSLFLGRGVQFPIALEGALKLKEVSYIHAEGYPAAEMKHGPIALIDRNMPVVFLAVQDRLYVKVLSNIEEVKARGGIVILVLNDCDTRAAELADASIRIPCTDELVQPILSVVPLQLLAYHVAVRRGCDVDRPRNLAKSVTVE